MTPSGSPVKIMGHECRLVDGTVATGPDFLRGRSVDGFVQGPAVPTNPPHSTHPYYLAPDPDGDSPWHAIFDPATNKLSRFQDPQAAALYQLYLDQGGSRYDWHEPGDGHVYVLRADEPAFSVSHKRVLAKAPAHKHHRHHAEKHLKNVLKGQMYDHLVRGFYPIRVAPFPLPASTPTSTPTPTPTPTGTVGVAPAPGAQGGSGGGAPTGGGSIPVTL